MFYHICHIGFFGSQFQKGFSKLKDLDLTKMRLIYIELTWKLSFRATLSFITWYDLGCLSWIKLSISEENLSGLYIQSTLVISNSKRLSEILRDIHTSIYQICRTEEKTNSINHI